MNKYNDKQLEALLTNSKRLTPDMLNLSEYDIDFYQKSKTVVLSTKVISPNSLNCDKRYFILKKEEAVEVYPWQYNRHCADLEYQEFLNEMRANKSISKREQHTANQEKQKMYNKQNKLSINAFYDIFVNITSFSKNELDLFFTADDLQQVDTVSSKILHGDNTYTVSANKKGSLTEIVVDFENDWLPRHVSYIPTSDLHKLLTSIKMATCNIQSLLAEFSESEVHNLESRCLEYENFDIKELLTSFLTDLAVSELDEDLEL